MPKKSDALEIKQVMDRIEETLDLGTYCVGDWQKGLGVLKGLERSVTATLSEDLTRISNKLHRRNRFPEAPFWVGLVFEYCLLTLSLLAMNSEGIALRLTSIVLLALCLQPLMKTSFGLLLGVRYSYVYLWYFEPRFKMRFGTYEQLTRWKKLVLQCSGSVGTPLALLMGWWVLSDESLLAYLCLAGSLAVALMQVSAFAAVWFGFRRLGPFLLTNLTTPALLAKEWKKR